MGAIEDQAVDVPAPERDKIWRWPSETSSKVYTTPASWLGKYVEFEAEVAGSIQFGATTAVTVVHEQDSTRAGDGDSTTPYTLTVHSSSGFKFAANSPRSWYVHNHQKYFAIITPSVGDIQVIEAN